MAVVVNSVTIVNGTQVRLNVSPMQDGTTYSLDIENVQDVDGTVIDPAYPPQTFVGIGVAPQVASMTYYDLDHLDVTFDMAMENNALLVWAPNYILTGPNAAVVDSVAVVNTTTVRLALDMDMVVGTYNIEVVNVINTAGTLIDAAHDTASYDLLSVGPFRNSATLVSGLISHYRFDSDLLDSHTNHYDAAWVNAPASIVPGKIDDAYYLNNSTKIADIATNDTYNNLTRMSISVWINVASPLAAGGFAYGIIGRRSQFSLSIVDPSNPSWAGHLAASIRQTGGITLGFESASHVPLNVWTHVVFTYGSVSGKTYINGLLDSTKATTGLDIISTYPIAGETAPYLEPISIGMMGRNPPAPGPIGYYGSLRGCIDELTVWTKELTLAEVQELYRSGVGLTY